jgi:hypothetical protein
MDSLSFLIADTVVRLVGFVGSEISSMQILADPLVHCSPFDSISTMTGRRDSGDSGLRLPLKRYHENAPA